MSDQQQQQHPRRILIAGWPRAGKTTFALRLKRLADEEDYGAAILLHTDDLVGKLSWSDASEEASRWLDAPGPWLIEGVSLVRALRKWLARHQGHAGDARHKRPCEVLYYSRTPLAALTPGQQAMGRGVETVWLEVRGELLRRGVEVVEGAFPG